MSLDAAKLKENISADLSSTIRASLAESQTALNDALKDSSGGINTALQNIKGRAEQLADADPADYSGLIRVIVSEEFAKAISTKIVEALNEVWVAKVSEALADCISSRIDAYIKSAEIVVPSGSRVFIPVQPPGVGASAGTAYVQENSKPARIS